MCVSVSRKLRGEHERMNSYFYCHRRNFQHFKTSVWSHLICGVKEEGVLSLRPILMCLCVTNASDGSQESSRHVPSHCQTLYVYKSAVPFFCADLSVLMDEDTSQVSSFHSLMEECMPCAPERRGGEPMHSDSSVKHEKWLLAVPDTAGYPHPVHGAPGKKKTQMYMHVFLHMSVYMCVFCKTLKKHL